MENGVNEAEHEVGEGGNHAELHRPHHSPTLDRNGVHALRGYLASAGLTPSQVEEREKPGKE